MIKAEKIRKNDVPSPSVGGISSTELRSAFSLGSVLSLRMLGLAMILPVFSLYAVNLRGNTHFLTGLAIGAYGLSQALLQIPFGILSDRIGRKTVIVLGLLIFATGSVVAALSGSIYGVIAGRAMQGGGAIAAAVMALLADLTREDHRMKAMAILGISIGASFTLALLLGPVFNRWIGVKGIFWLTAGLAIAGILITTFIVPRPKMISFHNDTEPTLSMVGSVLRHRQLLRLDFGILCLHIFITASFVVLPLVLRDAAGLDAIHHWQLYLPVLLLSVVAMIPFIILAEKYCRIKEVFLGAIVLISFSEFGLAIFHKRLMVIAFLLFLFFTAFNLLEASLASLVSRMTSPHTKGTAMGVYSSSQFFGAFLGGVTGGWILGIYGAGGVFAFCGVVATAWFFIAIGMQQP
jgi:MFS family permease